MNVVRSVISLIFLVLVAVSVSGWMWAGGQPSPKKEGARVVLALCGVAAVGGMSVLWSAKQPQPAK